MKPNHFSEHFDQNVSTKFFGIHSFQATVAAALLDFRFLFNALYFSFPSRDPNHLCIDEVPPRHPFHTGRMLQCVQWAWPVEPLTNCPAVGAGPARHSSTCDRLAAAQVLAWRIPERACDSVKNWVEEGQQTHWPHTHSHAGTSRPKGRGALNTDTSSLTSASPFSFLSKCHLALGQQLQHSAALPARSVRGQQHAGSCCKCCSCNFLQ